MESSNRWVCEKGNEFFAVFTSVQKQSSVNLSTQNGRIEKKTRSIDKSGNKRQSFGGNEIGF